MVLIFTMWTILGKDLGFAMSDRRREFTVSEALGCDEVREYVSGHMPIVMF